jgi:hypothetical protein
MRFLGTGGVRMRRGIVAGLVLGAGLAGGPAAGAALAADQSASYALVHGCFALQSNAAGAALAQGTDGSWRASAKDRAAAEPFRMQATDLGHYLLFGKDKDFLAGDGAAATTATSPGPTGDWHVVAQDGGTFRLELPETSRVLVAAADGALSLVPAAEASAPGSAFTFEKTDGCADFPEVTTNVSGEASRGSSPFGEVRGFVDGHLHHMFFEALGGSLHCGRPWHRYGVTLALPDCNADIANGGGRAVAGPVLGGTPNADQVGWPTFNNWPKWNELAYEGTYWKWMERAWLSGLRMFTNLMVDNAALCDVYPFKRYTCHEMSAVRREIQDTFALQDYIDAQYGGPGKGFYRVVKTPNQARQVINDGKLAVIIGIEISSLFDCGVYNGQPQCDRAGIDAQLNEMYNAGVRQMELVNKFDNALSGVAGDGHETGVLVNSANKQKTGRFWDMQTCSDGHNHDREQYAIPGYSRDQLFGTVLGSVVPAGVAPVYPEGPHCNTAGLTDLGAYVIRRMMEKGMLFDPDHMSVLARDQGLAVTEAADYSGVLSSHSWSDPGTLPRVYKLGGVVTPYAGSSTGFVNAWKETRKLADPRYFFGFGYGADMNGFGAQGPPREGAATKNPVTYPFKSFDGKQTISKQVSGQQEYDINTDGVSHYGLYPDWIEDLRKLAGDQIIEDMARGPEAYLQMWERATGIKADGTRPKGVVFSRSGLGAVRLGDSWEDALTRAGQPLSRRGRTFTYRVAGAKNKKARVRAVFTAAGKIAFIASTSKDHRAGRVAVGARAPRLAGGTRALGSGIRTRSLGGGKTFLYGVRKGRVTWVAVASSSAVRTPAAARAYAKLAKLR